MTPAPLVIAHRGGAREAPENTLAAFARAFALGVDGVEADVHVTQDGRVVVFHDDTLAPAPGEPRRPICDLDLATVRAAELAATLGPAFVGHRVPTLDELLALAAPGRRFMIEIKAETVDDPRAVGVRVGDELRRFPESGIVCGSFSPEALHGVAASETAIPLLAIADSRGGLARFGGLPLRGIAVDQAIVTPELVREQARQGRFVWTWTIVDEGSARRALEAGVEGLISDVPSATLRSIGR